MRYRETPLYFDCKGSRLLGVLAQPPRPARVGVVIVVGGPQYRVGSHRQFALLARALASAGIACLRFDYRGMGDSDGEARTFDAIDDDIAAAIDALQRETRASRVVLWGLCDGASASLMYGARDARVSGVVAVNPWARSVGGEAATRLRHYYLKRAFSSAFWRKVLAGAFDAKRSTAEVSAALRDASVREGTPAASFLLAMEQGIAAFDRPLLFVLSGNDLTAREFEQWLDATPPRRRSARRTNVDVCRMDGADHTFSEPKLRSALESRTIEWIGGVT